MFFWCPFLAILSSKSYMKEEQDMVATIQGKAILLFIYYRVGHADDLIYLLGQVDSC